MDFINDDVLDGCERFFEPGGVKENREGFGSCVKDMWRRIKHFLASSGIRIAMSNRVADLLRRISVLLGYVKDTIEWDCKIPMDIVRERF
jgi:hypothetical protein